MYRVFCTERKKNWIIEKKNKLPKNSINNKKKFLIWTIIIVAGFQKITT